MGILLHEVEFAVRAPDVQRVVEEILSRSGLEVAVTESSADLRGSIYERHAQLAFACAPEDRIAVYTLHPGAAADRYKIAFADFETRPAALAGRAILQAATPSAGDAQQMVYLKAVWDQEPTLFFATQLALERLGGIPMFLLTDQQRSLCDRPLTAAELHERRQRWSRRVKWGRALRLLLLPVTIPWTLLQWIVVAIVPGVRKLGRIMKALVRPRTEQAPR